jgi:signal transduction histidine kinase
MTVCFLSVSRPRCELRKSIVYLGLLVLLLGSNAIAAGAQESKRILVIYQDSSTMASAIGISQGLTQGLGQRLDTQLEVFTEFLDSGRFSEPAQTSRIADAMSAKYASVKLDAVVTQGPEALRFLLEHRKEISGSAPVVFGDISQRSFNRLQPPADVSGLITEYDARRTLDLALSLQPDADRIVVVSGSGGIDRYWQESVRQNIGDRYNGLAVEYLSGLNLASFVARAKGLSSRTIILILPIFEDADGRKFIPREAAENIASAAGAPSYAVISSFIGSSVVGGYVAAYKTIGQDIAQALSSVLAGDKSGSRVVTVANQSVVDWRQLQRWGIDQARVPSNAELINYTPTVWQKYQWQIWLIGLALLAETAAIVGLLHERHGRHAAENVAGRRLLELVHLNQSATAGALSASIAHELNQPLGAIRANAEAAEAILQGKTPDLKLVQQILVDIRDDDQRAGDIIVRLRALLKKRSEIDWQEFDLNDVVNSAISILHAEAEKRSVVVSAGKAVQRLPIRADRVHVQQVILNLAINAMDAMLDAAAERRLTFQTMLTEESEVEVSISDTGNGIPSDQLDNVFDAFYTTKAAGTGLGLSIARAIIETYGGKIWADNRPEGGAVFRFVLPLACSPSRSPTNSAHRRGPSTHTVTAS